MQMEDTAYRAIAIVGAGAVLPDAANVNAFWENVKGGRYSISEVARTAGIPHFITTLIPRSRTRRTPRLVDGCASSRGIR